MAVDSAAFAYDEAANAQNFFAPYTSALVDARLRLFDVAHTKQMKVGAHTFAGSIVHLGCQLWAAF